MTAAIDLTTARNADITTIRQMLEEQRARRLDLVVSPDMIFAERGRIVVRPGEQAQLVTPSGVVSAAGYYLPTDVADEGLGAMLSIDGGYLKRLRERDPARTDVWDANVNLMLHGSDTPDGIEQEFAGYGKNLLLRMLRGDNETDGVLRAVRSARFRTDMDNIDVLTAVLDGFTAAGVVPVPHICDLSSRRMRALAPKLLDGYRTPLDDGQGRGVKRAGELGKGPEDGGDRPGMKLRVDSRWRSWTVSDAFRAASLEGKGYLPGQEPVVFAGVEVTCSDVGDGGRNIFPLLLVQACKNGLTLIAEADKRSHLGSEKQPGVIDVSAETDAAELALITQQTKDAVITYSSEKFFLGQVAEIEALAGVRIAAPEQVVKDVTRANGFTKAEADGVWDMFLMGGGSTDSGTAGQVANAITAYSQTINSGDRAAEMDRAAVPVMQHLAKRA
jgi:hypothetical protein